MGTVRRAVALAIALAAGVVAVAWAHATLVRAEPAVDARVSRPPVTLLLEFSEAVVARTSRVELVAPDSQRLSLAPRGDTANARVLLAEVPPLPASGRYRVEWRLVGPDGHAVSGRYWFTVDSIPVVALIDSMPSAQATDAAELHEPPADSFFQQVVRFLSFLAMVTVIGSIAFALFVLPAATRSGREPFTRFGLLTDRRLRSLGIAGAWLLLATAVVRLTSHGVVLSGSLGALRIGDLADLLIGSTFGRGWLLVVVSSIVLLLGLRPQAPRWGALVGGAAALAISASFLGHPAAVPDVPLLAMGLDAVHVLAAGGWAGAILMLALAALPEIPSVPTSDRVEVVRTLLRSFTPLALTCAAILAVTGAIGGWLQLRALGLVLGSDYGMVLVRKVVIVVMIAALGAYHWRVVQPAVGSDRSIARLRRSLALDVALVLLVLILTALLTGTAPPVR